MVRKAALPLVLLLALLPELAALRLHLPAGGKDTRQRKKEKESPDYYTLSIEQPTDSVWPQYWIESKDAIPLQPSNSASPIALPLPFSFPFYQTPNRLLFLYPGGLLSPSPTPALWSSCYIAPLRYGKGSCEVGHLDKSPLQCTPGPLPLPLLLPVVVDGQEEQLSDGGVEGGGGGGDPPPGGLHPQGQAVALWADRVHLQETGHPPPPPPAHGQVG